MSTATLTAQVISSAGPSLGAAPMGVTLPQNTNACPPQPISLVTGNNSIACPSVASGYTVTGFMLYPVAPGSLNAKTLKGVNGDTGVPFTALAVGGASAGATFVVNSAGGENCVIAWF